MRYDMRSWLAVSAVVLLAVVFPLAASSQTGFQVLHSFAGQTGGDGSGPQCTLVSDGSRLYGTTSYGGYFDYGTLFSLFPDGSDYAVLHHFGNQSDPVFGPSGSLVSDGSVLYGTAAYGGYNNFGVVFSLQTDGTGYTELHNFAAYPGDGMMPNAGVTGDGTMLYGVTRMGGANLQGAVYSLEPNVSGATVIHSFPASAEDGDFPYAAPLLDNGLLYGSTVFGPEPATTPFPPGSNSGVIYSVQTDGSSYDILYTFGSQTDDGASPLGTLLSDGTNLYGVTLYGGPADYGTVFSLDPDLPSVSILHSFSVMTGDGIFPSAGLVSDGTRLYGATAGGGAATGGYYYGGTIFALNKDGSDYTVLHDFSLQTENGYWLLFSGLLLFDNTLYGTASLGGDYDYGVIFSYTLPSPTPAPNPTPAYMVLCDGDYNGDGESDLAIFRPSSGLWAVRGLGRTYYGQSGDIPVPGDYDGDGYTDIGIFRPASGLWAIKEVSRVYFGNSSDMPVPGDYNGDGVCDIAIWDTTTGLWAIQGNTGIYYGAAGDLPVPADYTGNGATDPGIFRPATGLWAIRGLTRVYFGTTGDTPIPADYVWYGGQSQWAAEIAIFRPSTGLWAVRGAPRVYFGGVEDIPLVGQFAGGLLETPGIFRRSTGLWAIRGITRAYFGGGNDIPVTR